MSRGLKTVLKRGSDLHYGAQKLTDLLSRDQLAPNGVKAFVDATLTDDNFAHFVLGMHKADDTSIQPGDRNKPYTLTFEDAQKLQAEFKQHVSNHPELAGGQPKPQAGPTEPKKFSMTSLVSKIDAKIVLNPETTVQDLTTAINTVVSGDSSKRPASEKVQNLLTALQTQSQTKKLSQLPDDASMIKDFISRVKSQSTATLPATGPLANIFNDFSLLPRKNKQGDYTVFKAIEKKSGSDNVLEVTTHSGKAATITKTPNALEVSGSKEAVLESVKQLYLLELAAQKKITLDENGKITAVDPNFKFSINPDHVQITGTDKTQLLRKLDAQLVDAFKEHANVYEPMKLPAETVKASISLRPGFTNRSPLSPAELQAAQAKADGLNPATATTQGASVAPGQSSTSS